MVFNHVMASSVAETESRLLELHSLHSIAAFTGDEK